MGRSSVLYYGEKSGPRRVSRRVFKSAGAAISGGSFLDISLIGDKELATRMINLPLKLAKKAFRKAAREAARPILASAKQNLATLMAASKYSTGRLQKSLRIKALKRSRKSFGVMIGTGTAGKTFAGEAAYGFHVETGTKHTEAKPFLRPALEANRANSVGIIADVLWKEIKQEIRKEHVRGELQG